MAHTQGSPCRENNTSNMKEFLRALSDIQSIDIDNLRAQFLETSKPVSENAAEDLPQKTNHTLEALKRETNRVKKCLEEEQNFRKEYVSVFGERMTLNDLHKMIEDLKGVHATLREETERLKEKNRSLVEEKRKALEEKSDALTSKHMGYQMTNNNPNIADLSDQNRPNKLGERYTELYDNQWTNAFEALIETCGQHEERAIEILLNLLIECHNFARTTAEKQMDDLLTLISGGPQMQLGDEIQSHLKNARKLVDVTRADLLFQKCERHIKNKSESSRLFLFEKEMKKYLIECFQICWLMAIQDPPVVLGKQVKHSDVFDTNMYKRYTRSGTRINFVVWPPLLLHEGGPLLVKGIAEPFQEYADAFATSKKKNYINVWEDRDMTKIRENSTRGTVKPDPVEDSAMTMKTITNAWQISTRRPQTTTSSSSSLVTAANIYPMTSVNQQRTTDQQGSTGLCYGMDFHKQSIDKVYSRLPDTISSTLSTSPNCALESENKSASCQRESLIYTSCTSQTNSKNKSTESRKIILPHKGSTSSGHVGLIIRKFHDYTTEHLNERQGHHLLTEQTAKPKYFQERVKPHSYKPLRNHEKSDFSDFVSMYNREGEWVTRRYYREQFDRYHALYLKQKQKFA